MEVQTERLRYEREKIVLVRECLSQDEAKAWLFRDEARKYGANSVADEDEEVMECGHHDAHLEDEEAKKRGHHDDAQDDEVQDWGPDPIHVGEHSRLWVLLNTLNAKEKAKPARRPRKMMLAICNDVDAQQPQLAKARVTPDAADQPQLAKAPAPPKHKPPEHVRHADEWYHDHLRHKPPMPPPAKAYVKPVLPTPPLPCTTSKAVGSKRVKAEVPAPPKVQIPAPPQPPAKKEEVLPTQGSPNKANASSGWGEDSADANAGECAGAVLEGMGRCSAGAAVLHERRAFTTT